MIDSLLTILELMREIGDNMSLLLSLIIIVHHILHLQLHFFQFIFPDAPLLIVLFLETFIQGLPVGTSVHSLNLLKFLSQRFILNNLGFILTTQIAELTDL